MLGQRVEHFYGSWFGGLASSKHISPPSSMSRYQAATNQDSFTARVLDVILVLLMGWTSVSMIQG